MIESMNVWIVEDEPGLQLGLNDLFTEKGYQVETFGDGSSVLARLREESPQLLVLDLGLPDMDGTELLKRCQVDLPKLPILVLTSRASEADVVQGFKLGADDYVTKPFSTRILLARAQSLIKRSQPSRSKLVLGSVTIDFETFEAARNGQALHLTTREFEILDLLSKRLEVPVSRIELLEEVWGMHSDAGPRTVDTHIAALRKKVEPCPEKPIYIISRRGIGYKLTKGERQ